MPVERPGAYTCIFWGMLPHFFRKLVIVVNFFKVCIFLLEGRRVTVSDLTVKLAAVAGRGGCGCLS